MDKSKERKAGIIFKRILPEIKPSKLEVQSTISNVNMLTSRLKEIVPKTVEIMVVGSIARGTNLKGDADVDIFMLFDNKYSKERLTSIGLGYAKRLVDRKKGERFEVKYAEHAYLRVFLSNGLRADIVPASKIDDVEHLATAVDRTPLHTEFINSSLSDRQRDDVRLLKYILKAHGIYGAEIRIGGFSGYLCELLVLQYGSILKLLEKAAEMKIPIVIDPKSKAVINDESVVKRFGSRFVVIDPVDRNRNVAAAVTEESLSRFVLIAREFISKPDISLFYGHGLSSLEIKNLPGKFIKDSGLDLFLLVLDIPDKSSDITWPQLRKVTLILSDYLKKYGFSPYLAMPWVEGTKGFILFSIPEYRPKTMLIRGPDVFKTQFTSAFMKKHKGSLGFILKEGSIYALERNRYSRAEEAINEIAKGRAIKRHKDIDLKGAKVFINRIPNEYSESVYAELRKMLSV